MTMDLVRLIVEITALALLVAIYRLLASGALRGAPGVDGPAGRDCAGAPSSAPQPQALVETLKLDLGGNWVHHGWARAESPAELRAIDTPGRAIRRPNGIIEAGRQ